MNRSISNDDLEIENQGNINTFCPFRNTIIHEESPTFQLNSDEVQSDENDKEQVSEVSNEQNEQENIPQSRI